MIIKGNTFNIDYARKSKEDIFIAAEVQKGKKKIAYLAAKKGQGQIQLKKHFPRSRRT